LEHRIRLIRDRLDRAVLVEQEPTESGEVGIGSTVEIEDDKGERMTLEISSVGGVSPDSPLGRALLGAKPGDEVEIGAPRGPWRARIMAIGGPQA
jgi:transcription elongation factor GreA